jgi:hypothetical protein
VERRAEAAVTVVLATDKITVRAAESLDSENFAKHMTHRHTESLGGLTRIDRFASEEIEAAYRAFHDRLHRLRPDIGHEHGTPGRG